MLMLLLAILLQGPAAAPPDSASIRVGGRTVATLHSSLGASSAPERAAAAEARIGRLLELGQDSIDLEPAAAGVLVRLGGERAFMMTAGDIDTLAGETLDGAAAAAAAALRAGVQDYRDSRNIRVVATGLGLTLLATILLVAVLRLLRRSLRWVDAKATRLRQASLPPRLRRLSTVFDPKTAIRAVHLLTGLLMWVVGLGLSYLYATFVLTRFPWTRSWGERLGQVLLRFLARLGTGLLEAVPDVLIVVLVLLGTRLLARGVQRFFEGVEEGVIAVPGLHPETAGPTRRIVTLLLWLFAVVVVYPYLPGSGSAAFKGVSVFAGLLLSLGSAGLVGQAMSGLVVMYARSYRPGDYVRVGEVEGVVQELGLLSTRLRTPKDEYVVVPNSVVTAHAVTNFSAAARAGHTLFLHSSVTIGYDVPRARVEQLLLEGAARAEGTLVEPAPFVLVRALNDWYVEYQVNVAVDAGEADRLPRLYSGLHGAVYDAFAEAGVEIMSPSYFALRDGNAPTLPSRQGGHDAKAADGPRTKGG